jgi:hypothetical protein
MSTDEFRRLLEIMLTVSIAYVLLMPNASTPASECHLGLLENKVIPSPKIHIFIQQCFIYTMNYELEMPEIFVWRMPFGSVHLFNTAGLLTNRPPIRHFNAGDPMSLEKTGLNIGLAISGPTLRTRIKIDDTCYNDRLFIT